MSGDARPKKLSSYVGQSELVDQVRISILSAMKRKDAFPHMIMAGPPGLGKTTLAEIVANEMGSPFFSYLASGVKSDAILDNIFAQLDSRGYNEETGEVENPELIRPGIIFIDEIHRLKQSITETLHTALEDFKITLRKKNNRTGREEAATYWIPRFTMIGATNYLGQLPKPFVDRFVIKHNFEIYNTEELIKVISFSAGKMGIELEEGARKIIAERSRGIPRIANSYMVRCRDVALCYERFGGKVTESCAKMTFDTLRVDELGLTKLDRKVLKYLADVRRSVGINSIAQGVDDDRNTVENLVEPWLVQLGFIVKTPQGRQITDKGFQHLGISALDSKSGGGLKRIMNNG